LRYCKVKKLTSLYLFGAVFFGPVAVMLTIVQYMTRYGFLATAILILFAASVLLCKISVISTIFLLVSS